MAERVRGRGGHVSRQRPSPFDPYPNRVLFTRLAVWCALRQQLGVVALNCSVARSFVVERHGDGGTQRFDGVEAGLVEVAQFFAR